jgi:signal peptidase I
MQELQTSSEVETIGQKRTIKKRARARTKELIEAILIALVIAVILRIFVVQAYRVDSNSMADSMVEGDFIFINKFIYHFTEPAINDIVVFEYPLNPSKDFIKRIVAVEGQTVEINSKQLYVDGDPVMLPDRGKYIDPEMIPIDLAPRDYFGPKRVPTGHVFVLGDNRDNSQDSRDWGFLDKNLIKGKAMFVYFSWKPDPKAPKWSSPYIDKLVTIPFHTITHFPWRINWGHLLRTF